MLISALTTGWVSPAHGASPTVPQYLAYDGATFSWFTTYPMFGTYMVIAIVVFDSSGNYIYTQNEAHGMMQAQSHFEDHYNIGT